MAPPRSVRSRARVAFAALLLPIASWFALAGSSSLTVGADPGPAPTAQVGPSMRGPAITVPVAVTDALLAADWPAAATALVAAGPDAFQGSDRSDWAFLTAFALVRAKRASDAAPYLTLIEGSDDIPAAYVDLLRGEVSRAAGDNPAALAAFDLVPTGSAAWPRATIERAEVLRALSRTEEGFAAYAAMAERPDPAPGSAIALVALARRHGAGSPEAAPYIARLWTWYPRGGHVTDADALVASSGWKPSWQQAAIRAEILMDRKEMRSAIAALEGFEASERPPGLDDCRLRYVLGRSRVRTGDAAGGAKVLSGMEVCTGEAADYGAKGLYVLGQALLTLGRGAEAETAWLLLGSTFPGHAYADDGLTEAGLAALKRGDQARARTLVERAILDAPAGDTTAGAAFKVAFDLFLAGDTPSALALATRIAALPITGDWVGVQEARYWAARWKAYTAGPGASTKGTITSDPAAKAAAIAEFRALCLEVPEGFYAIQAWARLSELAPEVAAELAARPEGWRPADASAPWDVRAELVDQLAVREAASLARLGLIREAEATGAFRLDELTAEEIAWWYELRIASGDWLLAHDAFRQWLKGHPPASLGDQRGDVLRVAYPDRYLDEITKASEPYTRFEPRMLHALAREESNFNRTIQSKVGARGLTQLMPGTARETAGRLGITVAMSQLDDPYTNARLGAKYLDTTLGMFKGNPYLALAGYNAGPGRVGEWLGAWGNVPTDEFVERIPFTETRGYVKRVMGSWQIMRYWFDDGAAYPDLSAFIHQSKPG
jgi:soluble lytic murein transglycosylase